MKFAGFALAFAIALNSPNIYASEKVGDDTGFGRLAGPALFTVTPSTPNLLQGQALSLLIAPVSPYPKHNLRATAVLDGVPASVTQVSGQSWLMAVGPFTSVGSHTVSLSLEIENAEASARLSGSIKWVSARIRQLEREIARELDPVVKAALQRDQQSQIEILASFQEQLLGLRTPIGSQDFVFDVSANTSDPSFPLVASINPNIGTSAGGTAVTISGSNFTPGATVKIGGVSASGVTVVNATTITALSPALALLGSHDVEVTGAAGNSVLPRAFFAVPSATPTPVTPPVAVTTGSQVLQLGQPAAIDGSQSFDWAGRSLNFQWSFLATPLNSAFQPGYTFLNSPRTNFVPDAVGVYIVQLIVRQATHSMMSSSPSLAVVVVSGPPAPSSPPIQVLAGGTATSQVSANDSNGVAVFYEIKTEPEHGDATVNAQGLVTFTADTGYAGADSVEIKVTNQYGLSGSVVIPITILEAFQE